MNYAEHHTLCMLAVLSRKLGAPHHRWAMHRSSATCYRGSWAQNWSAWFRGAGSAPQCERASETKQKVGWGAANE